MQNFADCVSNEEHLGKLSLNSLKLPLSQQSISEIRSPSLNQSFFRQSGRSSSIIQINQKKNSETSNIRVKKELFGGSVGSKFLRRLFATTTYQKKEIPHNKNKYIQYFIQKLKQKAYIYQDMSPISKTLIQEKYLESQPENKTDSILHFYTLFEVLNTLFIFTLLFWIPFEMGFQLQSPQALQGITILIIGIDLSKFLFKANKSSDLNQKALIDVAQLTAYLVIEFQSVKYFSLIALVVWLVLSWQKIKIRLNQWQNLVSFDVEVVNLFIVIIVLIHYCACMWHFIGINVANSWLTEYEIDETNNFTKYCYSLYWSTAQLLGVGQISVNVKTEVELIYSSFVMFTSFYLSAYVFVKILSFQNYTKQKAMRRQINTANEFLKHRDIPYGLKCQVRRQLQQKQNLNDYEGMLEKLTPNLRRNVLLSTRKSLLLNCRSLNKFSNDCIEQLTQYMELLYYDSNQNIQTNCSLYIIGEGIIEVLKCNKVIANLKQGDSFDDYNFFSDQTIKLEYRSIGSSKLYKIQKDDFIKVIKGSDYERYLFIKHSLQQEIYSNFNLFCYSCSSNDHLIDQCPLIYYKPSKNKLIKALKQSLTQRSKYPRRQKRHDQVLYTLKSNQEALKLFQVNNNINESLHPSSEESSEFDENEETSQLQEESNLESLLKSQQQQRQPRVSLLPINQQKSSLSQIKRFSLQDLAGEKPNSQNKQVTFKLQSPNIKMDKRGTLIHYDDQLTEPLSKHNQSIAKNFPSNISLIPVQVQDAQSISLFSQSNIKLPKSPGFLDLSSYNQQKDLDFDRLYRYTIYFPHQNLENIIRIIRRKRQ